MYKVDKKQAKRFAIVEIDQNNNVISLEEKPKKPKSDYVVAGLYFLTNESIKYAKETKLSKRGEFEITDVLKRYLEKGKLKAVILNENLKWIDAGDKDSLLEASLYIKQNKYL